MSTDQLLLFSILAAVFALLIWGRWRYDVVAFGALVSCLLLGVVDYGDAFDGFGHPATVVVALVLIISRGLSNSGVVELIASHLIATGRALWVHIVSMSGLAAALSALMNNVAALALLMPVDLQAAKKAGRSPAMTLMPLSFASILGGMVTLIGTPPNIVIASFRGTIADEPFRMFDFSPVGIVCALAGVAFTATIGWRLIPQSRTKIDTTQELFELDDYVAELRVPESAKIVGKSLLEIEKDDEEGSGAEIVAIARGGERLFARRFRVAAGDSLVVQGNPEAIEKLAASLGIDLVDSESAKKAEERGAKDALRGGARTMIEVVVQPGSRIDGQTAGSLRLLEIFDTILLGISRQGQRLHKRLRRTKIRPGDILLLLVPEDTATETRRALGVLPLAERGLQVIQRNKAGLAVVTFVAAVALASFGLVKLTVALAAAVLVYTLSGIVPPKRLYETIEWPVVVLLGSMIPIGVALEKSGGTEFLAESLVGVTSGQPPIVVLGVLMVLTMTLSDVMNNTATAVIAAPIAVDVARKLEANPDPFLMAVAVAASCAFLTPIGHKNNTLIMGPGGYRFGDYWRMGLPLEVLVIAVAIPTIAVVWPLSA